MKYVRSLPPGSVVLVDNITLTKDNLGCHIGDFPVTSASSSVYDTSYTYYFSGVPFNHPAWWGTKENLTNTGWVRTFTPSAINLWNGTNATPNGTLSATGMQALLALLDWYYTLSIKVFWTMGLVPNYPAWTTSTAYTVGKGVFSSAGPNRYYICTQAGTSSAAPSGTGTGIVDGSCLWDYVSDNYPDSFRQNLSQSGAEQNWINFFTALLTYPSKSGLGYTLAEHPALAAIELGNEVQEIPANDLARCFRIARTLINQYRSVRTQVFGCSVIGSSRSAPLKDWTTGSAVSLFGISCGSPPDDGTGKRYLDYAANDGWACHYYDLGAFDTTAEVRAVGNGIVTQVVSDAYNAAIANITANYWYGLSSTASGVWNNSTSSSLPLLWNTESDISGSETSEGSGGWSWGSVHPAERKWRFFMWMMTRLLITSNGSGGLGTYIYYRISAQRTYTNQGANLPQGISSATISPAGLARITLSGTAPAGGYGPYDDFVIYAGSGWPELNMSVGEYRRFVGQAVSTGVVDLLDSAPTLAFGTVPANTSVYMIRWMYASPDMWGWFTALVSNKTLSAGVVIHPKTAPSVSSRTNFGVWAQVGDMRPIYTDSSGTIRMW